MDRQRARAHKKERNGKMHSARCQSSYEAAVTTTARATTQGEALVGWGRGQRAQADPAHVAMANERAAEQNRGQKGG